MSGNLEALAEEMGNSPEEIPRSYKRGISKAESERWFGILPPDGYEEKILAVLNTRQKAALASGEKTP